MILCTSILIDSIYRKYENYYPKVFYDSDDSDHSVEEKLRELISSHPEILDNSIREKLKKEVEI